MHRLWDGSAAGGPDKDDRDLPAGKLHRDGRARMDIDYGDTAMSSARPSPSAVSAAPAAAPNGSAADGHLPAGGDLPLGQECELH